MYLVFTGMPGESYSRRLESLLLRISSAVNFPVCWFCTSALGLVLFQIRISEGLAWYWTAILWRFTKYRFTYTTDEYISGKNTASSGLSRVSSSRCHESLQLESHCCLICESVPAWQICHNICIQLYSAVWTTYILEKIQTHKRFKRTLFVRTT